MDAPTKIIRNCQKHLFDNQQKGEVVVMVQGQERSKEIYQKTLDTVLSQYYNTRRPHGCFCMKLHCDIENICKFKVTNIFVSLRLFVPDLLP